MFMHTSNGKPLTLRQQIQVMLDRRVSTITSAEARKLPEATDKLKGELSRLTSVLARLDDDARQRILYVMTQEMEILAYQFAVQAADLVTKPLREQALAQRDEQILNEAIELFEELVE
jgi:long-subunit acyl-CoA synthetase (AMP-forming)